MVFRRVRNFYHFKFRLGGPKFYHFNAFGNQNFYRHNQQFLQILLALRATGEFTTLRARGQSKRARKHVCRNAAVWSHRMRAFLACAACSDTACAATLNVPARDVPERGALCGGGHAGGAILQKDLMAMKVAELKEELEARGEVKTGCKA